MVSTSRSTVVSELRRMRDKVDKLLEEPIQWSRLSRLTSRARTLPIDMYETSEHVVIKATVAGLRPEEVSICVTGNILAIKTEGKDKDKVEVKGGEALKRERFCGRFERCITLPSRVSVEKAQATLRNSELVLRLPKLPDRPRYIRVQTTKVLRDR